MLCRWNFEFNVNLVIATVYKKVLYIYSGLVTDDFVAKLQAGINHLTTGKQLDNPNKSTRHILVIQIIFQPTEVAPGKWKVEMFANQLIFSSYEGIGETILINKEFFLQATDESVASSPNELISSQLTAFRINETKLKMYRICALEDNECIEEGRRQEAEGRRFRSDGDSNPT